MALCVVLWIRVWVIQLRLWMVVHFYVYLWGSTSRRPLGMLRTLGWW